jgi:hypothetical protein
VQGLLRHLRLVQEAHLERDPRAREEVAIGCRVGVRRVWEAFVNTNCSHCSRSAEAPILRWCRNGRLYVRFCSRICEFLWFDRYCSRDWLAGLSDIPDEFLCIMPCVIISDDELWVLGRSMQMSDNLIHIFWFQYSVKYFAACLLFCLLWCPNIFSCDCSMKTNTNITCRWLILLQFPLTKQFHSVIIRKWVTDKI